MRPATRPRHAGLTTIEVLVAVTLLVSAISATLAVQAKATALASRVQWRRLLAIAATSTLDSLRTVPCATLASGSAVTPSGTLAWRVAPTTTVATITLSAVPTGGIPWRIESVRPCP
ncbi:MAG: hypothetical protein IT361_18330 [Gemmatimonadaceae bacterium]|nr:hypothetical protein [Gemmatimonadaceae bacterium]